jgi:sialidase-1
VAIVDRQTGTVHFLYCIEYERCFSMRSDDDGRTFSAPVEMTATFEEFRRGYPWTVLAVGPGHGIQLKNGRLVVPVWISTGTGGNAHRPSVTSVIFSDDHGRSWRRGEIAVWDTPEVINPNETVAIQLADGRVMLNVRNEAKANRRVVVTSPDGATAWSPPSFDQALYEPICMASLERLSPTPSSDRNRIIFANPHNLSCGNGKEIPGQKRDRKNLSIKLSYDEGETWPVNRSLEPGPSAYSDLAVLPDGTMLCHYGRGGTESNPRIDMLTVARFNLEWLTNGRDTLSPSKE